MISTWTSRAALAAATLTLATSAFAADATPGTDTASEISALKAKVAQLEQKEGENWLNDERTSQIKAIVSDCIADAKKRDQFLDGDFSAGYNNGFYLQSADKNFKLVVGGFVQFRYLFAQHHTNNASSFSSNPTGIAGVNQVNASGFEIRRARVNFSGNVFSPDITFKLEGDFGGAASNSADFQVTDAFLGYRISDMFKIRAGSFKVPFAKAELTADTGIEIDERAEVLLPFDPVRALGISLYGDIMPDTMNYEVNVNDGAKSNISGRIDDNGTSAALDNRMAFYGRLNYAGAGKIADFTDEPDLRKDNSALVWLVGVAAGYESQNDTTNAFPHAQSTATINGLSTNDSPGFLSAAVVNGDLYRATADFSAKYQGWSLNTAGYFQEINQNPGLIVGGASTPSVIPYGNTNANFFEVGYYGQVGYLFPQKFGIGQLEVVGRAGQFMTEGLDNRCEAYTVGLNYYIFGHGAKIQTDVTYIPNETGYTDSASDQLRNTADLIYRLQLQVKF